MPDTINPKTLKERVLFYLDREITELESLCAPVDHEQMAKRGKRYAERRAADAEAALRNQKYADYLEALKWAREKLMEFVP